MKCTRLITQPRRSTSLLEWLKLIVPVSMPQEQPPAASLRLARLTWHKTNGIGSTFVTRGGNLLTMNGSPNLGTADKSLSGLNIAIIRAGAMEAMDTMAVAVAAVAVTAVAVAVAVVAAVEAGIRAPME
jgi:hypothetical protein